jgi:hypothetical protein
MRLRRHERSECKPARSVCAVARNPKHRAQPSRDDAFHTLVAHFFQRFFDTDTPSEESVPRTRLIQVLALTGVLTPWLLFFMIRGGQRIQFAFGGFDFVWARLAMHFTFVSYAMAVMGLVMTFKWDSLFPDRRDYLILTPLPISPKRLFAARTLALGLFLGLFVVAINAVLTVAVAFLEPSALLGHVVAVLGASAFAVLFFAALQGVLINLLTPDAFRRISPTVQMISIALLITVVLIMPLLASSLRPLARIDSALLDYFPPIWFLGVYESLSFSPMTVHAAAGWAWTALKVFGVTALIVSFCYGIGYLRHSRKILEGMQSNDLAPRWWDSLRSNFLHSLLLTNPSQRAAFEFIGKIAERSARHRVSAALYSGLGVALALSALFVIDRREAFPFRFSASGVLEAPAVLSFLAVAGWRATFSIPYELPGNWIFQMAGRAGAAEFRKAIRKWVFVCRILPLYIVLAVFEFAWFDSPTAFSHLVFDLVTTAFLTEAFFFGFKKVPFTCTYLRSKLQFVFSAVAYLYAFTVYKSLMGSLKGRVAADPLHLIRFLAVSAILFGGLLIYRSFTRAESTTFIYDESDSRFQRLNLS